MCEWMAFISLMQDHVPPTNTIPDVEYQSSASAAQNVVRLVLTHEVVCLSVIYGWRNWCEEYNNECWARNMVFVMPVALISLQNKFRQFS